MDRPDIPPVASRRLKAESDQSTVIISVWAPEEDEPIDWRCAFEILGGGLEICDYAHGVDSIQALQNAFKAIRIKLSDCRSDLRFVGEPGELGFPCDVPDEFGLEVEQELNELIDARLVELQRSSHSDG